MSFPIDFPATYKNEIILNLNQPCALTIYEAGVYFKDKMAEYDCEFFEGGRSKEKYDPAAHAKTTL